MKQVLIITSPRVDVFSTLVALCKAENLPYHTLKSMDFPIHFYGYTIEKIAVKR